MLTIENLVDSAVKDLQKLISIPSVSRDECRAADELVEILSRYGIPSQRKGNNVWCRNRHWDDSRHTILLNAHIDTVKPVSTWTRDPFTPALEGDKLYGLGSNDCGGGLMSLLQVFRTLYDREDVEYNYLYLASCEEEVSGVGGIRSVIGDSELTPLFSNPSSVTAVVGEPTGMQPAIAERGLMVIDGVAHGKSGHAARGEGINAINKALDDLLFIREYKFQKVSPLLGETKMQCTIINSGTQHNVVPDECRFTIDVRTNEEYTNEEVLAFLQEKLTSTLTARSTHLRSSSISQDHPLVKRCLAIGMTPFGSPTLSDQALMPFPSFKLGPGQSARSHSADEYICISEIKNAIDTYLKILN